MNHVFFGIIWVLAQILRLLYRIEVKGLENLPRNGVLLCPNHASDLDPVLIGICLPINYRLHFMAKGSCSRIACSAASSARWGRFRSTVRERTSRRSRPR